LLTYNYLRTYLLKLDGSCQADVLTMWLMGNYRPKWLRPSRPLVPSSDCLYHVRITQPAPRNSNYNRWRV